ncbi:hypothetical protein PROFUN_15462 [Planoprotostelium fungivorum]|uniref:FAD-binding domain-containing protein n=1 Tax=Planoprotostelium fungivorum TaxID=1890364 RepID=A0A2P6MW10_9EUKA|nr:hypothetical protein PROFUN_15462 [Planoprotostelium fungivorum]
MNQPVKTVIIIGSGPGGASLSIALAKKGISSTVCELREGRGHIGGYITLAPNGVRILDQMGIWSTIQHKGQTHNTVRLVNESGRLIGEVLQGGGKLVYPCLSIHRTELIHTLHDAAEKLGVKFLFSKKAVRVEETEKEATVYFEDGTNLTADLIVGFDGIHSKMRAHVIGNDSIKPRYTGQTGIAASAQKANIRFPSGGDYRLPYAIFGQKGLFAIFSSDSKGEAVTCVAVCNFDSDRGREGWAEFAEKEALSHMRDTYAGWSEPVKSIMESIQQEYVHIWPQYDLPEIERWRTKRVVIAGDAVHAMAPAGGQGTSQALEDAALLVRSLCLISETRSLEDMLDVWEGKRKERVRFAAEMTKKSTESRKQTSSWLKQVVKEWVMWAYLYWRGSAVSENLYMYDVEKVDLPSLVILLILCVNANSSPGKPEERRNDQEKVLSFLFVSTFNFALITAIRPTRHKNNKRKEQMQVLSDVIETEQP